MLLRLRLPSLRNDPQMVGALDNSITLALLVSKSSSAHNPSLFQFRAFAKGTPPLDDDNKVGWINLGSHSSSKARFNTSQSTFLIHARDTCRAGSNCPRFVKRFWIVGSGCGKIKSGDFFLHNIVHGPRRARFSKLCQCVRRGE
jgi:hypothetical protein